MEVLLYHCRLPAIPKINTLGLPGLTTTAIAPPAKWSMPWSRFSAGRIPVRHQKADRDVRVAIMPSEAVSFVALSVPFTTWSGFTQSEEGNDGGYTKCY